MCGTRRFALGLAAIIFVSAAYAASAQDASRAVAGGGISVAGWTGRIDPKEMSAGEKLGNAKLAREGDALCGSGFWGGQRPSLAPYVRGSSPRAG